MNKIIIVTRILVIVTSLNFLTFSEALGHISERSEEVFKPEIPHFSEQDIIDRLDNISSVIDINYTYEVGRRVKEYTVNYRKAGEEILGKVDLYFPLFEQEIHKRNLPDELKYIAVVESNLDPTATSRLGATGLWQFISSTGRMQGLKITSTIDERRDPLKSTQAALDYLFDLYCEFDDWTLAIAAYNCGPGNVRKAIRRGGSYNYWDIRSFLPNETQKYVPRIIAAMYLMQYYHVHNLSPRSVEMDMKYTVKINDGRKHSFYTLSKDLDVSVNLLKSLNPQFKGNYIPKHDGSYNLVIPRSKYEEYLRNYDIVAYKNLIESKKQKRLNRLAEIQKMMQKDRIEPLTQITAIPPKQIFSVASIEAVDVVAIAEE